MTPKEKAEELIKKFMDYTQEKYIVLEFGGNDESFNIMKYQAKKISLIVVDIILLEAEENDVINFYSDQGYYIDNIDFHSLMIYGYDEYWKEVKKEIELI